MTDETVKHSENDRSEVLRYLTDYIRREFLDDSAGADQDDLTPETPLLKWGILNSMNIMMLVSHIRERFDVPIHPVHITGTHFRSTNDLTDLVLSLRQEPSAEMNRAEMNRAEMNRAEMNGAES